MGIEPDKSLKQLEAEKKAFEETRRKVTEAVSNGGRKVFVQQPITIGDDGVYVVDDGASVRTFTE